MHLLKGVGKFVNQHYLKYVNHIYIISIFTYKKTNFTVKFSFDRLSSERFSGPDGIEAWTVALAACTISFVMAGLARMSGILYVAFIDIYHIDRREASLPFSVRSSMRNLFGTCFHSLFCVFQLMLSLALYVH